MISCGHLRKNVFRLIEPMRCAQGTSRSSSFDGISTHWSRMSNRSQSSVVQQFEEAQKTVSSLKNEPDNDLRLKLYGLYKQATVGVCATPKPGSFDFVANAKWNAWSSLGNIGKDEAAKQYVDLANRLASAEGIQTETSPSQTNKEKYKYLQVISENAVTRITLNRPEQRNCLTIQMYKDITEILNEEAKNDATSFVVFQAAGDYYCSGNDLANFMTLAPKGDFSALANTTTDVLRKYVAAYIDFPKPLVAAIKGPASGIAVTVLGLFDVVYVSDTTILNTPFSALGISPEGCSSYTFPKIMGTPQANQLLMLSRSMTAEEAKTAHLVTEIFPAEKFHQEVEQRIQAMTALPIKSLIYAKELMRSHEREPLHRANAGECERLKERLQSQDCQKAIAAFFQKKSKT